MRGRYLLMNNLNSATAGYAELASQTANQGRSSQPIGSLPNAFAGTFDGQGFEIRDLSINCLREDDVGLFSFVNNAGIIK